MTWTGLAKRELPARYERDFRVAEAEPRPAGPGLVCRHLFGDLFISALTVGEIRLGIERLRRKDSVQADVLERWLDGLRAAYGDHVVDVDVGIAEEWGRLNIPDPLPVIDGLLAASAQARGWTLARNVANLARCDVPIINPFDPPVGS